MATVFLCTICSESLPDALALAEHVLAHQPKITRPTPASLAAEKEIIDDMLTRHLTDGGLGFVEKMELGDRIETYLENRRWFVIEVADLFYGEHRLSPEQAELLLP